ncbi:putative MFS multidrug transporter [Aspergillus sclerotiicarbonarius CBS 121057]|uniref:Putative MFS multidrug transporter n=1 Tax=Aspergillus sclerotiicarbonarius (strain CBS 121057 / IBT 28362) TaxID=1448318 RepID=A0A319EDU8_ASPSB|nr:putative MFS multidrug transporter [Aspergillus sclerotiicarbonarius CBS 121057]
MSDSKEFSESAPSSVPSDEAVPSLSPLRLNIIVAGLWISLFLAALDSTIISTALLSIASDFHDDDQSGWIVTAYLLTYNAFVLILAKLSDVVGLKQLLLACNGLFLVASIACSVARSMEQLIIFRAIEGIGASGLYCLVFIAILQLVSLSKTGLYSGIISSVFALSNLAGPLLGGVIVDNTTWRWIFYMNIPISSIAILILGSMMPAPSSTGFRFKALATVDWVGAVLSISWLIPLLFALEEGGSQYSWKSSVIIGTLIGGIVGLITFLAYEAWVQRSGKDAIFPVRFLYNSVQGLLLLNIFFTGFAFYTAIITLPQRFQAVNGVSASRAGVLELALTLCMPFFSLVAGMTLSKRPQWTYLVLIFGCALLLIATACLSHLPVHKSVPAAEFGFQVIMGAGLGIISPTQYFALKISFLPHDTASATGAMNMLRAMGGCIGLAITTSMLTSKLEADLPLFLAPDLVARVKQSLDDLSGLTAEQVLQIRAVYGKGYDSGFQVLIAFAGANVLVAVLLLWASRKRGGVDGMFEAIRLASES